MRCNDIINETEACRRIMSVLNNTHSCFRLFGFRNEQLVYHTIERWKALIGGPATLFLQRQCVVLCIICIQIWTKDKNGVPCLFPFILSMFGARYKIRSTMAAIKQEIEGKKDGITNKDTLLAVLKFLKENNLKVMCSAVYKRFQHCFSLLTALRKRLQ